MVSPLSHNSKNETKRYEGAFEPKSSRKMTYPDDFIRRVKECFPNLQMLHQRLEEGNCNIGVLLYSDTPVITIEEILNATSLEKLQEKAGEIKRKDDLYAEWLKLCKEQSIH